jgi:hypothetical protein
VSHDNLQTPQICRSNRQVVVPNYPNIPLPELKGWKSISIGVPDAILNYANLKLPEDTQGHMQRMNIGFVSVATVISRTGNLTWYFRFDNLAANYSANAAMTVNAVPEYLESGSLHTPTVRHATILLGCMIFFAKTEKIKADIGTNKDDFTHILFVMSRSEQNSFFKLCTELTKAKFLYKYQGDFMYKLK